MTVDCRIFCSYKNYAIKSKPDGLGNDFNLSFQGSFGMNLSWDSIKREDTIRARGLDFADAEAIFAGFHVQQVDDRIDYGEVRWLTIGAVDDIVLVVIWTQRPDSRRVISMRKANAKEAARYRDGMDRSR